MQRPIKPFKTIEEIRAHEFAGNHASDWAAFNGIEEFVKQCKSLDEQYEALDIMFMKGMGLEPLAEAEDMKGKSKQQCVDEFLDNLSE